MIGERDAENCVGVGHGFVATDGSFNFDIAGGPVVDVAAIERAEVIMPRALDGAGGSARTKDLVDAWANSADLFGGAHTVFGCNHHGVLARLFVPAIDGIGLAAGIEEWVVPVNKGGAAKVAIRINPRAVFDVDDGVSGYGISREVLLDGRGMVPVGDGAADKVLHVVHVVAIAAAVRVVSVVRQEDEHRARGVVKTGDGRELVCAERLVAIDPAKLLRRGYDDKFLRDAGIGVNPLRLLRSVREGRRVGWCAPARDGLAVVVGLGGVLHVGEVRRFAIFAATAELEWEVGTPTRDMVAGDDAPVDALGLQNRNEIFAESHLRGKVTA